MGRWKERGVDDVAVDNHYSDHDDDVDGSNGDEHEYGSDGADFDDDDD